MLNYRNPGHLKVTEFDGKFSHHPNAPLYSVGQGARFIRKSTSASGSLGPGHYRVDREVPLGTDDEVVAGFTTKSRAVQKFTFNRDPRTGTDGALRGISATHGKKSNMLGPGQYNDIKLGGRYYGTSNPIYSIPKGESADAVRERKLGLARVDPGRYEKPGAFDEIGRERTKTLERLVKQDNSCWAEQQYRHIFTCMKQSQTTTGTGSLPTLTAQSTRGVSEAAQTVSPTTP